MRYRALFLLISCSLFSQNPSAAFCAPHPDVRFDLGADLIYWRPSTHHFPFAHNGSSTSGVSAQGRLYVPNYSFEPGFKVAGSLNFAYDGWELRGEYTWLYFKGSRNFSSVANTGGQSAIQFLQEVFGVTTVNSASYHSHGTLNLGKLELGRDFYTSPHLTLRPSVGLSVIGFPFQQVIGYNFVDGTAVAKFNSHKDQFDSLGAGVSFGFDTNWKFTEHWSLLGKYYFSPVWTRCHINTQETDQIPPGGPITNLNVRNTPYSIQPFSELFFGLEWQSYLRKNQYRLHFHAGCEMVSGLCIAVQGRQGVIFDNTLNFYGLTAGSRYDF